MLSRISSVLVAVVALVPMGLAQDCTFKDEHGDIPCGTFSVVFGSPHSSNKPSSNIRVTSYNATLSGDAATRVFGPQAMECPSGSGDQDTNTGWESYQAAQLNTVHDMEVHGGRLCSGWANYAERFDNLWIRYNGEIINIPGDTRCGKVGNLNLARRCLIAQN